MREERFHFLLNGLRSSNTTRRQERKNYTFAKITENYNCFCCAYIHTNQDVMWQLMKTTTFQVQFDCIFQTNQILYKKYNDLECKHTLLMLIHILGRDRIQELTKRRRTVLTKFIYVTYRNIKTDNRFTFKHIAKNLHKSSYILAIIGPMRRNEKYSPNELFEYRGSNVGTIVFCFEKDKTL